MTTRGAIRKLHTGRRQTAHIAPLLLAVVFICHAAVAAPKPPQLLDRDAVVQSAAAVTSAAYPNADDVIVDEAIHTAYKADGTYRTWDDEYIKILTEKGKRRHQTVARYFTRPYGTVEVTALSLIKPDGTTTNIDVGANSRVMVNPGQMSANIYNPNSKILRVSVPGLEIGDVLHIRSFRDTVKARVPNTWSDYTVLEYTAPIVHMRIDVHGPKSLPLSNIRLYDAVSNTVSFSESASLRGHRYQWEVRDVPRMFPEPNMPAPHTVVQRLLVSTIEDWATISRWYWKLCAPHLEAVTPAMKAKVTELVDGIEERTERITRIFTFVSQQIRYMGITTETTAPGYEPHDVSITFDNRYGVCRDKAALLVAMLRLADLPAYPVLIHAGPRRDSEVPQPFFNHAVVAVGNADGSYMLMDPTDENTAELFPAYLNYMSYLVAHPEGEDLRTSPVVPAAENLLTIDTTGALTANGHLSLSSRLTFEGINDNAYRRHLTRLQPEERRQFFEGHLKRRVAGAKLTGLVITPPNMRDTTQPLVVRLDYEAPDYPIDGDRHTLLAVPWLSDTIGSANFLLGKTGLETRKYPLYTRLTAGVRESFTVALDPAMTRQTATPERTTLSADGMHYDQAFHVTNQHLHADASFMIDSVEFSPEAYLELKQLLKDREYEQRKRVLFIDTRPHEPDHDIRILVDDLTIEIQNPTNWISRHKLSKQILTYAGKKDHAELKLPFNPAWETVELASARIVNPDGSIHEVVENEMNLMDANWVGSAPRYPPERTLVVSLPGVEVGSVITYEIQRRVNGKPFFSLRKTFQGFDPIDAATVTVSRPANLVLRIADRTGGADYRVVRDGARTTHTWHIGPQEAIKPEDHLPPRWTFMPTLVLSTGAWAPYTAGLQAHLAAAMTNQTACVRKARALTADCASVPEKMRRIRDFVARNIRRAGPWLTALPWSAITPADTTLADGYGNTTDRAVVLAVMLDAAGISSDYILASVWAPRLASLTRDLKDAAQRGLFTHLLVRVMDGNRAIYLNETDQYAQPGATPFAGRPGLSMRGTLLEIKPPRSMTEQSRADFLLEVAADGDVQLTATRAYYGTAFGNTRRIYEEMPPEERRRHYLELVASLSQSATAMGELDTDFEVYPGFRAFTVDIPRYAMRDGKYLYLTLPSGISRLLQLNSDTRNAAFYRGTPERATVRYDVKLPPATRKVHLIPPTFDWEGPDGLGAVRFTQPAGNGPHHLTLKQEVDLNPAVVRPEAYPVLLNLHQRLQHPSVRTILVELE